MAPAKEELCMSGIPKSHILAISASAFIEIRKFAVAKILYDLILVWRLLCNHGITPTNAVVHTFSNANLKFLIVLIKYKAIAIYGTFVDEFC